MKKPNIGEGRGKEGKKGLLNVQLNEHHYARESTKASVHQISEEYIINFY